MSTLKKSVATMWAAWTERNDRQVGPLRRGAGPRSWSFMIRATVLGARVTPRLTSSPWIRR